MYNVILDMMRDVKEVKSGWFNAFRPWTLHGAVIPVLIGGVVAYHDDGFCWWIFLMVLVCGCLLQSAANLLNTYGDFKRGTDTVENETRSPELVTGTLKPKSVFMMGLACLAIVAACGLVFIWYIGWGILIFGLLGIAGAGMYTTGAAYKYHAMGLVSVFFMMGILMPMGTYYLMVGELSWEVLYMSIPNAFMITAVLSGNEVRDYFEDKKANVNTFSGHLSFDDAVNLYLALNIVPFFVLAALIAFGILPWPCALAFISLYDLYLVIIDAKGASSDDRCRRLLVPSAFKLNWHFGALLVVGYLLSYYVIEGFI